MTMVNVQSQQLLASLSNFCSMLVLSIEPSPKP